MGKDVMIYIEINYRTIKLEIFSELLLTIVPKVKN